MKVLLAVLLGINLIFAVLYAVRRIWKRENPCLALFFLFLPWVGIVLYFLPRWLQKLFLKEHYDRDSLVKRLNIEKNAEHVDLSRELNVVPVKDAMAVSDNFQKRALLLNQLRKDIRGNYRELLAAGEDRDSESAHYVAAAKMEVYGMQQREWVQAMHTYEADPKNAEKFHTMLAVLESFLSSGLLSLREEQIYKRKYCEFVEVQLKTEQIQIFEQEMMVCLEYLIDLEEFVRATQMWEARGQTLHSEECYMKVMEMFYRLRDKARFDACIQQLRADSAVKLSAPGLEKLRYWLERE